MTSIQIYPRVSPRIVKVLSSTSSISMQDLVNYVRDWEDDPWNMTYEKIISATGKQSLGSGISVGITAQLENAKLMFESRTTSTSIGTVTSNDPDGTTLIDNLASFQTDGISAGATIINFTDKSVSTVLSVDSETKLTHEQLSDGTLNTWITGDEYKIWNVIQCDATGGNLVAINTAGTSVSPIMPSAFTQVIKTSSSSATLQELEAIQYSSFNNGVSIDVINGTAGTQYPLGTEEYPVNNISDAKIIALDNGFNRIYLKNDITFTASNIINGYRIIGEGQQKTTVSLSSGCSTNSTYFESCSVSGTQSGETYYSDCEILDLSEVYGWFNNCSLVGPIVMHNTLTNTTQLINCYNGNSTTTPCIINHNNSKINMRFSKFSGGMKLINLTYPSVEIIIVYSGGGSFTLDQSCTSGTVRLFGSVLIEDTSIGTVLQDNSTGDIIWTHKYTPEKHSSGTFGNIIGSKLLTVAKFLGLK
jgi:hypothetical protein